eukprot:scaffold22381_cov139-Skeletonema_marinoi.AAC.5
MKGTRRDKVAQGTLIEGRNMPPTSASSNFFLHTNRATMTSTSKQMFEGVGAPIHVDKSTAGIDPTLDSCCQREIETNRKQSAVEKTLRAHDRVAQAENERRQFHSGGAGGAFRSFNLVHGLSFGSGCRCCYDPNTDGGDYELLAAAKEELMANLINEQGDEDDASVEHGRHLSDNNRERDGDDDSSDDDSEFDYLLDDDVPGLSSEYENQRRAELENLAQRAEILHHHGYGVHRQMHPQRVFAAAGYGTDTMRDVVRPKGSVIHLFDAFSQRSVALDLYLERIAAKYHGTKFVRGIGVASILYADGNGDDAWKKGDLPMLLAVREGKVVAWNAGLKDFFSSADLETRVVGQWLDRAGVLFESAPSLDEICRIRPEETALLENMMKLNRLGDGGLEEEERYNCGVAGCCKSFQHEHVGVKTEAQNGLLVSEDQVLCQEISN